MGVDFRGRAQACVAQLCLGRFQRFSEVAEQCRVRVPEAVPCDWRQPQARARWFDTSPENVLRIERSPASAREHKSLVRRASPIMQKSFAQGRPESYIPYAGLGFRRGEAVSRGTR